MLSVCSRWGEGACVSFFCFIHLYCRACCDIVISMKVRVMSLYKRWQVRMTRGKCDLARCGRLVRAITLAPWIKFHFKVDFVFLKTMKSLLLKGRHPQTNTPPLGIARIGGRVTRLPKLILILFLKVKKSTKLQEGGGDWAMSKRNSVFLDSFLKGSPCLKSAWWGKNSKVSGTNGLEMHQNTFNNFIFLRFLCQPLFLNYAKPGVSINFKN